jgi:hypothetical protein
MLTHSIEISPDAVEFGMGFGSFQAGIRIQGCIGNPASLSEFSTDFTDFF